MYGRFRSAWIRFAKRIGRSERVKLAEEYNASVDRGGRPCLQGFSQISREYKRRHLIGIEIAEAYLTRSAKLREC